MTSLKVILLAAVGSVLGFSCASQPMSAEKRELEQANHQAYVDYAECMENTVDQGLSSSASVRALVSEAQASCAEAYSTYVESRKALMARSAPNLAFAQQSLERQAIDGAEKRQQELVRELEAKIRASRSSTAGIESASDPQSE